MEEDSIVTASLGAICAASLVDSDLEPAGPTFVLCNAVVESSWVSLVHVGDCLFDYRHIVSLAANLEFHAMLSAFGVSEFCHLE